MPNPRSLNGTASPLSHYATSTTQYHRIGSRGILDDRVFHYASMSNSTGIVSNNLCQAAIPDANHVTETGSLGVLGGTQGFVAGATTFSIALGASAIENQYEDGYIHIQSSTLGPGQVYKLRKHAASATVGGTSNVILVESYDPILTTPTGTVTWTLTHNPWAHVIITPVTTITGMLVGVPLVTVPAASATTAPVYFWMQTWGPCSVFSDSASGGLVVGAGAIASAVVGHVDVAVETDVKQRVGVAMGTISTDTVYANIFLQIAP